MILLSRARAALQVALKVNVAFIVSGKKNGLGLKELLRKKKMVYDSVIQWHAMNCILCSSPQRH